MTADRRPTTITSTLIAVLGLVVAVNLIRSLWLPPVWHLVVALGLTVTVLVIGRRAGLGDSDLGLGSWRRGAMVGGLAAGVVVLALILGALVADSIGLIGDLIDDERTSIDLAELLVRVVVIIPVGTVLVEELIFRGVLLGQLLRLLSRPMAVGLSAVIFGLWHLLPVGLATSGDAADIAAAVVATFIVTTAAGVGFAVLRLVSGSLLAPVIAHTTTNSGALLTAWLLA